MSLNLDSNIIKEISYYTGEPSWISQQRYKAWELFNKLPIEISPLYVKHHDITKVNLSESQFFIKSEIKRLSEIDELLSQINSMPYVCLIDGQIYIINIPEPLKEKGLDIYSIQDLLRDEENAKKLFSMKNLRSEEDKFIALNDALFCSGFYINIPSGLIFKLPLRIINFQSEEGKFSVVKNFINVGEDS